MKLIHGHRQFRTRSRRLPVDHDEEPYLGQCRVAAGQVLPQVGEIIERDARFGGELVPTGEALRRATYLPDAAVEPFDALPLIGIDKLADDRVTEVERAID